MNVNQAFEQAAVQGKFVLLSLAAVWSEQSKQMDRVLEDKDVQKVIQDNFIIVRADVDCDPEIAARYNMGGYPSLLFLASSGDVIDGGNFIPKDKLLKAMDDLVGFVKASNTVAVRPDVPRFLKSQDCKPGDFLPKPVGLYKTLKPFFDEKHGGLKGIKFPLSDLVRLCWIMDDKHAELTLDHMIKLNGDGFFSYGKEDWSPQSKEKFLSINADMLKLFNEAYLKTNNEEYKNVVNKTKDFILSLKDKAFKNCKFEGGEDDFIYTDSNAKAISALLSLDDEDANKQALEVLDWILDNMLDDKLYHYFTDKPNKSGLMQDYAYLIQALLDAAEKSKDGKYLEKAELLTKQAIILFFNNGFKDYEIYSDAIGYLKLPLYPIQENSIMAFNLHRLANILKNPEYARKAKITLLKHANVFTQYKALALPYVITLHKILS